MRGNTALKLLAVSELGLGSTRFNCKAKTSRLGWAGISIHFTWSKSNGPSDPNKAEASLFLKSPWFSQLI
ncbi:hypothetical protein QQP08_020194 [Theobroma cacao]|nr:hypothetical protein QQP08_020194 [Theobroma cacao]